MARAIRTIEPAAAKLGVPRERWLCYGSYFEVRIVVGVRCQGLGGGWMCVMCVCIHGLLHVLFGP
jgi:hypothetical protein